MRTVVALIAGIVLAVVVRRHRCPEPRYFEPDDGWEPWVDPYTNELLLRSRGDQA